MGLNVKSVLLIIGLCFTISHQEEKPCDDMMCLCNVNRVCKNELKSVTLCTNEKSKGMQCMIDLTASGLCPVGHNETNILYKQYNGLQHAEKRICQEAALHSEYKNKPHCWYPAVQCSQILGFDPDEAETVFCRRKKLAVNLCKQMDYLADDCKELHVKFLDGMYKTTACRNYDEH